MRLGEGDILVFRTGHHARRLALGPWNNDYPPEGEGKAGLHVDTVPWMHERQIAAFLPDGDGETVPSNVEKMPYPIHALQLTAMGMLVSDSLQLEELAAGLRGRAALGVHGGRPAVAIAGRHGLALESDRHILSRQIGEIQMERRFAGKVALVTGATSGIGQATAVRLAAEGALVAVNRRPDLDADQTLSLIKAAGGEAFDIAADMRDPERGEGDGGRGRQTRRPPRLCRIQRRHQSQHDLGRHDRRRSSTNCSTSMCAAPGSSARKARGR